MCSDASAGVVVIESHGLSENSTILYLIRDLGLPLEFKASSRHGTARTESLQVQHFPAFKVTNSILQPKTSDREDKAIALSTPERKQV